MALFCDHLIIVLLLIIFYDVLSTRILATSTFINHGAKFTFDYSRMYIFKWILKCHLFNIWNIYIILVQLYQSNSILSIIIDRISMKLPPSTFAIDCNEGRSIFIQFKSFNYYFALSIYFFYHFLFQIMQRNPIW